MMLLTEAAHMTTQRGTGIVLQQTVKLPPRMPHDQFADGLT